MTKSHAALDAVERQLTVPDSALEWEMYQNRYQTLLDRPLTAAGVPEWLQAWSALDAELQDVAAKLSVHKDLHTDDEGSQKRYQIVVDTLEPASRRMTQALTQKLLGVDGYSPDSTFALAYRRFKDAAELFREANVDLTVTHQQQMNRHSVAIGNQTVQLGGQSLTVPQARQLLDSPDRAQREQAWRALQASNQHIAPELDSVMLDLIETRRQLARNADQANYRDFRWKELDRVDYTPEQCLDFHQAVASEVVPVLTEYVQGLAESLKLGTVRPWDYNRNNLLDPQARESLKPFKAGRELEELALKTYGSLDPELAMRFQHMRDHGLLDLESRAGKMTHAYCAYFPTQNDPFVLMNVVGSAEDVRVLFHEVGHAFHGFYSGDAQPLVWNRWSPIEFVEIPSMAMEFLTLDHLGHAFGPEDLQRYRTKQLEGVLAFLPWAAQMDAFQHWLYAQAPESVTIVDLDAKWLELDRLFHPFIDWSGLDESIRAKGWQYYHIFQVPFYYIEYAMCYLAAVGIWRAAQADPQAALDHYRAALRLGNAASVPELYRAAGVEFRFDREYIRGLTHFLQGQLAAR